MYEISKAAQERERTDEEYRRRYQRDQERKEAASRGRPQAVQACYGRDYLGRAFVDASLPWVEEQAGGIVRVDVEGAASQGVQILDLGSGVIRMEE